MPVLVFMVGVIMKNEVVSSDNVLVLGVGTHAALLLSI